MKDLRRGYKIFGLREGSLSSLTMGTDGRHVFSNDFTAVPRSGCGPFAVFDSLEAVINFKFAYGWKYNPVCEVEYEPSEESCFYTPCGKRAASVPPGTQFAKSVRVIKYLGI